MRRKKNDIFERVLSSDFLRRRLCRSIAEEGEQNRRILVLQDFSTSEHTIEVVGQPVQPCEADHEPTFEPKTGALFLSLLASTPIPLRINSVRNKFDWNIRGAISNVLNNTFCLPGNSVGTIVKPALERRRNFDQRLIPQHSHRNG